MADATNGSMRTGIRTEPHDPCLISNLKKLDPDFAHIVQESEDKKKGKLTLISKQQDGKEISIALYVDDLLIAGDESLIKPFVKAISQEDVVRDLGVPETFLGCEIRRAADKKCITVSCTTYIEQMAKKFGLLNSFPVSTPMVPGTKLSVEDQSLKRDSRVDSTEYRSYVGSLLYAAMTCRPDISYAVKELSRFLVEPLQAHLQAAKHCVKYLYTTLALLALNTCTPCRRTRIWGAS